MTTMILAWHEHGSGWAPRPWWPLLWLLVVGLVVGVTAWVFRRRAPRREAEAVLAERYARGDLTDEEYRHRLAVLSGRKR